MRVKTRLDKTVTLYISIFIIERTKKWAPIQSNAKTKVKEAHNKRPQAKCPPTFEMSICGEYVYNICEKKVIRENGKFLHPSPPPPLTKCNTDLGKLPGALQNTYY